MEQAVDNLRSVLGNYPLASIIEAKSIETDFGNGFYSMLPFFSFL